MARKRAVAGSPDTGFEEARPDAPDDENSDRSNGYRGALIRKSILDAAAELFAERGLRGTSLRDLADVLGVSRPGLYYHFPSKEKLLKALIEGVTFSSDAQFKTLIREMDEDPERALRRLVRTSTSWVLENPVLFRILDRSEAEMPDELRLEYDAAKKASLEHLAAIIDRGVQAGKFRLVDPCVAALAIASMYNWAAWWFKPSGRMKKHQTADMIAEMAVRSLVRPDVHRSRSDRIGDAVRILKEDLAHLDHLLKR